jgi:DHA1 family bicyclomycin/chloramphenicol resistance-like MFS transporter
MLVVGNGFALVMQRAPAGQAGSVSSMLAVVQYGFAGAALGLAYDGTLAPFVVGLLLCAAGALIAYAVATRLSADAPRAPHQQGKKRGARATASRTTATERGHP